MFKFFELTKSRLRSKLLAFYFANSNAVLYMKEISQLLDEDCGNLQKELVKLEKEGLFHSFKRGNQRYYILNKEYLFFNELASIFARLDSNPVLNIGQNGFGKNLLSERKDWMTEVFNKNIYEKISSSKEKEADLPEQLRLLVSSFDGIKAAFLFENNAQEIKEAGHDNGNIYLCIISSGGDFDNLNFNSKIEAIQEKYNYKIEYVIYTLEEWRKSILQKKGFIFRIFKSLKIVLFDIDNLIQNQL
jgi:hypothetical protein